MTLFARTLERYRKDYADRLPFLKDSPPANLHDLLRRLPDLHGPAFESAVRLVSDLKDRRALPMLLQLLRRGNLQQAELSAQAIATIGGRKAAPALLRILAEAPEEERRWAALYGVTWLMDERAWHPLLALMQDRSAPSKLRTQAAEALTYLTSGVTSNDPRWKQAVEAFTVGLDDADVEFRFWCIYALGAMQAESALPKLRELAQHDDGVVPTTGGSLRDEAAEAVAVIEAAARAGEA